MATSTISANKIELNLIVNCKEARDQTWVRLNPPTAASHPAPHAQLQSNSWQLYLEKCLLVTYKGAMGQRKSYAKVRPFNSPSHGHLPPPHLMPRPPHLLPKVMAALSGNSNLNFVYILKAVIWDVKYITGWWPPIGVCRSEMRLLRPKLTKFDLFFCKMYLP